jgi:hypothetical protein
MASDFKAFLEWPYRDTLALANLGAAAIGIPLSAPTLLRSAFYVAKDAWKYGSNSWWNQNHVMRHKDDL